MRGARGTQLKLMAAGVALAAAGCAADVAPSEPAAPVWVEVGHGLTDYEHLDDGDALEIVHGSQGGWHVDLAAHFGGTQPTDHFIVYRIWDRDHEQQISYPIKAFVNDQEVIPQPDGSYAQVGIRTVFAIDDPAEVVGQRWLVEAELIVRERVFVDLHEVTFVDDIP